MAASPVAMATQHPGPSRALRAVLWDIDGTLLDSESWHRRATIAVCEAHGYVLTRLSAAERAALTGVTLAELHARLHAVRPMPLGPEAWIAAISDAYIAALPGVRPRDGAFALVEAFAARGLRQACVSNGGRRVVEANLRAMALPHLEFAVSRDDVMNGKPDPEPYRLAARRMGVPPEACVAIEDSPTGARSAKAAGMLTVAWPQDPHLAFPDADHVVRHPDELDWDAVVQG